MFVRPMVRQGGMVRPMQAGDGLLANYVATALTVDAPSTLTVAQLAGGLILRSGASVGRTDTSPTAALIAAAFPDMDIGDSLSLRYSNTSTQTMTLAAGVGVTASGRLAVLTLTALEIIFVKTGAATYNMIAI